MARPISCSNNGFRRTGCSMYSQSILLCSNLFERSGGRLPGLKGKRGLADEITSSGTRTETIGPIFAEDRHRFGIAPANCIVSSAPYRVIRVWGSSSRRSWWLRSSIGEAGH